MKEVEVKPERARGLGVITPSLHTMQVEYPNEKFTDVRVKRTDSNTEVWYRGMNRHTQNLNKGDIPTEIIIPRSTVFFSDTKPYQDALEFSVRIQNTEHNVSQGVLDLYISRETGSDDNPNIIMNRILVHSMRIDSTDDIRLLVTDLEHWDWVVGAMQALHQNPYTGYTLYVEYQDDHDLFRRCTAKSKIGIISYNTEVHSKIQFYHFNDGTPKAVETNGVVEYVQNQEDAHYLKWRGPIANQNSRRFYITYDLYGYHNNLLEGLKVDVLVTDYESAHRVQVPQKDSQGNVITDNNGDPVYVEQTFAPGQPIDAYGEYTPEGQTAGTQGTSIHGPTSASQYATQGKWYWVIPDDFMIAETSTYPHMVRVDFVVGRNSGTFYGYKNPLTNEVEHPNLDTKYGSMWTFWIRVDSDDTSGSGGVPDD